MARRKSIFPPLEFPKGYWNFHRRIWTEDMKGDGELVAIWCFLLSAARISKGKIRCGDNKIDLEKGQIPLTEKTIIEYTGFSRQIVRSRLKYLAMTARVQTCASPYGTIVTVLNHSSYNPKVYGEDGYPTNEEPDDPQVPDWTRPDDQQVPNIDCINKNERTKERKNERLPARAGAKAGTPGSEVWNIYSQAFHARYGHEPKRNAKANANAKQLVERLGLEEAKAVIAFYLTHDKRWYVEHRHALQDAVKDAEALFSQMMTDDRVTSVSASAAEKSAHNRNVFSKVAKEFGAHG